MSQLIAITEQGKIQGKVRTDVENNQFLAFCGIPYAKPPLGNLRFKDPQPPEPWTGFRDCTRDGACCFSDQFEVFGKEYKLVTAGSEDCLFLNVFTHKLKENERDTLKPVMVWIHGGGFMTGSSSTDFYGPEALMTQDIVLVSINYRLGALGFLSIKDQLIGNAGLKDQVQALKWVKSNISRFGGDPNCVTIFGDSAGGASVQHLVLSPLAKGLFHRAIAQSGSVLNPWTRGQENNAIALARVLGCDETNGRKILQFLQNVPVTSILEGQRKLFDRVMDGRENRLFCPVVEPESPSAYLCEDPVELLRTGRYNHVPYMTGCTSQEGLLVPLFPPLGMDIYSHVVPPILGYDQNQSDYKEAEKRISKFYYGSNSPNENNKTAWYNILSDVAFLRGVYVSAKAYANTSTQTVYLYMMTAETKLNTFKKVVQTTEPGVSHGDELGYLFKHSDTPKVIPGSVEDLTRRKFLKLWTNFARYGNPTPSSEQDLNNVLWKPLDVQRMNFLEIGTTLGVDINFEGERMEFWDELLKSHPGY